MQTIIFPCCQVENADGAALERLIFWLCKRQPGQLSMPLAGSPDIRPPHASIMIGTGGESCVSQESARVFRYQGHGGRAMVIQYGARQKNRLTGRPEYSGQPHPEEKKARRLCLQGHLRINLPLLRQENHLLIELKK